MKSNPELFKIKYISNSGILVEGCKGALLIDGIFEKENEFNGMTEKIERYLCKNFLEKKNKVLLFSHYHKDHFSVKGVERVLVRSPDLLVILPYKSAESEYLNEKYKGKIFIINNDEAIEVQGFLIKTLKVNHPQIRGEKPCQQRICILQTEREKIFLSMDLFPGNTNLADFLNHETYDYAFFNPMFLFSNIGMDIIESTLAKRKYIYHLPLEANDKYYYRRFVVNKCKNIGSNARDLKLLLDELQDLTDEGDR